MPAIEQRVGKCIRATLMAGDFRRDETALPGIDLIDQFHLRIRAREWKGFDNQPQIVEHGLNTSRALRCMQSASASRREQTNQILSGMDVTAEAVFGNEDS